MSRLDALPADQKSVLQLLLRQGKGYDDLSALLRLDRAEVRARAHDALDALGPGAGGVASDRRGEIADWLLGQQGPDDAAAARAFVAESPTARAWARAVAGELEPLAGDRLPQIPEQEHADAPTPITPAPAAAPRVSRRGGALLIGGVVAAIAAAVVLIVVLTGGDDNTKDGATTAKTTSTQAKQNVLAQVELTPAEDAPVKTAAAIVQIVDVNGQEAVKAVSQGLPTPKKGAYGIWVYASPSQTALIGAFDKPDKTGRFAYVGPLARGFDLSAYREVLVTHETSRNPKRPGNIYLRGAVGGG